MKWKLRYIGDLATNLHKRITEDRLDLMRVEKFRCRGLPATQRPKRPNLKKHDKLKGLAETNPTCNPTDLQLYRLYKLTMGNYYEAVGNGITDKKLLTTPSNFLNLRSPE